MHQSKQNGWLRAQIVTFRIKYPEVEIGWIELPNFFFEKMGGFYHGNELILVVGKQLDITQHITISCGSMNYNVPIPFWLL